MEEESTTRQLTCKHVYTHMLKMETQTQTGNAGVSGAEDMSSNVRDGISWHQVLPLWLYVHLLPEFFCIFLRKIEAISSACVVVVKH